MEKEEVKEKEALNTPILNQVLNSEQTAKEENKQNNDEKKEESVEKKEIKDLSLEEVVDVYSFENLKVQTAESNLLGTFNQEKQYKLFSNIYPELVALPKMLVSNSETELKATGKVNGIVFNFLVVFEKNEETNEITATLNLVEYIMLEKLIISTITTPIQSLTKTISERFLLDIRTSFHIKTKDDPEDKYMEYAKPIEIIAALEHKKEIVSVQNLAKEKFDKDYLNNLIKELHKTDEGRTIINKFFQTIKLHSLQEITENRTHVFKGLLDDLVSTACKEHSLDEETVKSIGKLRKDYLEDTKKEIQRFVTQQELFGPIIAKQTSDNLKPIKQTEQTNSKQKQQINDSKPELPQNQPKTPSSNPPPPKSSSKTEDKKSEKYSIQVLPESRNIKNVLNNQHENHTKESQTDQDTPETEQRMDQNLASQFINSLNGA